MLPHERQQKILELVRAKGTVTISELCPMFDVTSMTVRRDLRHLAEKSLLEQTYGGATIIQSTSYEPPFPSRQIVNAMQKKAIAKRAAELVRDGDTVALDVGTTTLELARCLRTKESLLVLTASTQVALELAGCRNIRVILAGGEVRPGELSVVGEVAVATYERFYVDKAFLGAAAVSSEHGVSDFNLEDTVVKKAMIARAKQVILLADCSKFGKIAFARVCPLNALHMVVTDSGADRRFLSEMERSGVEVVLAEPG